MCYKDYADASAFQVAHQLEQHRNFFVVQRGSRFVENQDLAVHIHGTGNRNHLLYRQRAAGQFLRGSGGDAQVVQDLRCPLFVLFPVHDLVGCSADEHIFRYRQVRAECDFLIYRTDPAVLGLLRRMDMRLARDPFDPDASGVFFINARQHFDQSGFPGSVFSHQRMDFSLTQGKIHIFQRFDVRKIFADPAHG